MRSSTETNIRSFKINDRGTIVQIKQPSFNELVPLYYVLLKNLEKINKKSNIDNQL